MFQKLVTLGLSTALTEIRFYLYLLSLGVYFIIKLLFTFTWYRIGKEMQSLSINLKCIIYLLYLTALLGYPFYVANLFY